MNIISLVPPIISLFERYHVNFQKCAGVIASVFLLDHESQLICHLMQNTDVLENFCVQKLFPCFALLYTLSPENTILLFKKYNYDFDIFMQNCIIRIPKGISILDLKILAAFLFNYNGKLCIGEEEVSGTYYALNTILEYAKKCKNIRNFEGNLDTLSINQNSFGGNISFLENDSFLSKFPWVNSVFSDYMRSMVPKDALNDPISSAMIQEILSLC